MEEDLANSIFLSDCFQEKPQSRGSEPHCMEEVVSYILIGLHLSLLTVKLSEVWLGKDASS